jgi:hypothetical protein
VWFSSAFGISNKWLAFFNNSREVPYCFNCSVMIAYRMLLLCRRAYCVSENVGL